MRSCHCERSLGPDGGCRRLRSLESAIFPRLPSAATVHWFFGFSNLASSMGTLCLTSVSLMVKLKSDRT